MSKILVVDPDKCTGCQICSMICSLTHWKECSPAKSNVRVFAIRESGIDLPVVCMHCEDPPCMVCPLNAISKDPLNGAVILDQKKCVGCKLCRTVCPLGAIGVDTDNGKMLKCDLCEGIEGGPQCVKWCPTKAIDYVSAGVPTLAWSRWKQALLKAKEQTGPSLSRQPRPQPKGEADGAF